MSKNFFSKQAKEKANAPEKVNKKDMTIEVEALLEAALMEPAAVAKEEPTEVDVVEEKKEPVTKTMITHKAMNAFYDSKLKKFMLVTIDYDVESGYSKIVEVKPFADDAAVAAGKLTDIITLKLFRGEERK